VNADPARTALPAPLPASSQAPSPAPSPEPPTAAATPPTRTTGAVATTNATTDAGRTTPGLRLLLRSWAWGWLAIAQLVTSMVLAGFYIAVSALTLSAIFSLAAVGFGLLMLAVTLPLARAFGVLERLRVEAFLGVRIDPPRGPAPGTAWWRRIFLDGRSWRATLHLAIIPWWGLITGSVMLVLVCMSATMAALPLYWAALPEGELNFWGWHVGASLWLWGLGTAMLLILPLVARGLTGVDLALARSLLGQAPQEQVAQLTQRVETLTQTREMAVDSVELERRRIERDLHDGPQQRLVAIAMDLGMAQTKLEADPDGAKDLLDKAHTAAKEAIVEMRQVARGIHPPVLTDRGLDAALSALAARSPVPVHVHVDVPTRPNPTLEAIAYFCVSEALTNVAKHSGARAARVEVVRANGGLRVQVSDDGRGGVDLTRGTGLVGLRQRLAAVDGTLSVESPVGLGTRLVMTLPERADSRSQRPDQRPDPRSGPTGPTDRTTPRSTP